MRKRNVRAAIAAALCMTVLAAGCGKKADDPVFTGDKTEAPVYQANLDAIKSSVYALIVSWSVIDIIFTSFLYASSITS